MFRYSLGNTGTGLYQSGGTAGSDGTAPGVVEYGGDPLLHTGFYALDKVDLFNLMILPGDREVPEATYRQLLGPASIYCEQHRAFLLIDAPDSWTNQAVPVADATAVNSLRALVVKDHSAVFYPKVQYSDAGLKKLIGAEALDLLGEGIRALQESNFLSLTGVSNPNIVPALADNPEVLKITFDEASVDLLAKVMQGTDEQYRLSVAFQVRPVMIATGEPPSYSLLVGVDYSAPAPVIIGEQGRQLEVLPSLGPTLTELAPLSFELDDVLPLRGTDLHLSGLTVMLGPVELPIIAQRPDQLKCRVDPAVVNGATISAGSHALAVTQTLESGRRRSSNLLVGNLLPVLTAVNAVLRPASVFATIKLTGKLLGKTDNQPGDDDVMVALYRDGATVKLFDVLTDVTTPPVTPPLEQKQLVITTQDAVPAGQYLVLLRVNGQQARQGFAVNLTP